MNIRILNGKEIRTGGNIIIPILRNARSDYHVYNQKWQEEEETYFKGCFDLTQHEGRNNDVGGNIFKAGCLKIVYLRKRFRSFSRI